MSMVYINNGPGDVYITTKRGKTYRIPANGGTLTVSGAEAAYLRNFAEGTNGCQKLFSISSDDSTVAVPSTRVGDSPESSSLLLDAGSTYDTAAAGSYDANLLDLETLLEAPARVVAVTLEAGGSPSVLAQFNADADLIYTIEEGETLIFSQSDSPDAPITSVAIDNNQSGAADSTVTVSAIANF